MKSITFKVQTDAADEGWRPKNADFQQALNAFIQADLEPDPHGEDGCDYYVVIYSPEFAKRTQKEEGLARLPFGDRGWNDPGEFVFKNEDGTIEGEA